MDTHDIDFYMDTHFNSCELEGISRAGSIIFFTWTPTISTPILTAASLKELAELIQWRAISD